MFEDDESLRRPFEICAEMPCHWPGSLALRCGDDLESLKATGLPSWRPKPLLELRLGSSPRKYAHEILGDGIAVVRGPVVEAAACRLFQAFPIGWQWVRLQSEPLAMLMKMKRCQSEETLIDLSKIDNRQRRLTENSDVAILHACRDKHQQSQRGIMLCVDGEEHLVRSVPDIICRMRQRRRKRLSRVMVIPQCHRLLVSGRYLGELMQEVSDLQNRGAWKESELVLARKKFEAPQCIDIQIFCDVFGLNNVLYQKTSHEQLELVIGNLNALSTCDSFSSAREGAMLAVWIQLYNAAARRKDCQLCIDEDSFEEKLDRCYDKAVYAFDELVDLAQKSPTLPYIVKATLDFNALSLMLLCLKQAKYFPISGIEYFHNGKGIVQAVRQDPELLRSLDVLNPLVEQLGDEAHRLYSSVGLKNHARNSWLEALKARFRSIRSSSEWLKNDHELGLLVSTEQLPPRTENMALTLALDGLGKARQLGASITDLQDSCDAWQERIQQHSSEFFDGKQITEGFDTLAHDLGYRVRNGRVLIICNRNYNCGGLKPILGEKCDGSLMEAVLSRFGLKTQHVHDCTSGDISQIVTAFCESCAKDTVDFCGVYFSGHGDIGGVLGIEGGQVSIDMIKQAFQLSELCEKPKVFGFDCCRGSRKDQGITRSSVMQRFGPLHLSSELDECRSRFDSDASTCTRGRTVSSASQTTSQSSDSRSRRASSVELGGESDDSQLRSGFLATLAQRRREHADRVPSDSDYLIAYAASDGKVAFGTSEGYSRYTQSLVRALQEGLREEHEVRAIFQKVTNEVGRDLYKLQFRQCPPYESTLTRPLYIHSCQQS